MGKFMRAPVEGACRHLRLQGPASKLPYAGKRGHTCAGLETLWESLWTLGRTHMLKYSTSSGLGGYGMPVIIYFILGAAALMLLGAVVGLLPLLLGRYLNRPGLGKLGMLCCIFSGLLPGLQLPVAIGFILAIFIKKTDFAWPQRGAPPPSPQPNAAPQPVQGNTLYVTALCGPLRGQSYPVGRDGLLFGCDPSCAVRFPAGTPGISHQHCCIRWQQGVPMLVDLNSTYGTFAGDGRKLPPSYPTQLAAGSRFYLGDTSCLFQLTLP